MGSMIDFYMQYIRCYIKIFYTKPLKRFHVNWSNPRAFSHSLATRTIFLIWQRAPPWAERVRETCCYSWRASHSIHPQVGPLGAIASHCSGLNLKINVHIAPSGPLGKVASSRLRRDLQTGHQGERNLHHPAGPAPAGPGGTFTSITVAKTRDIFTGIQYPHIV